ncbi:hypothetical protein [Azospirillum sp. TSO22-1]|uniref:hypothetical protein n=1 Tax=Azospirillum sp. TSO22-1 TaxID=716789 RepID=UPI000D61313B|nr:hypothetical protein [Azospirillum sp. TSO22-1]PWC36918.1 hypothetical protein TSO221_28370 [Azospirillum sp. TSO22-1]
MGNAVATSITEPFTPLDVHQLHVAGVPEATELLKRERFVFVGAPNRWRKEVNGRITRADIRRGQDGRCVVVLFHWQQPQTRCGGASNSVGSLS